MADRKAALVRQVGERNSAGEILVEQFDRPAFLQGSDSLRIKHLRLCPPSDAQRRASIAHRGA